MELFETFATKRTLFHSSGRAKSDSLCRQVLGPPRASVVGASMLYAGLTDRWLTYRVAQYWVSGRWRVDPDVRTW